MKTQIAEKSRKCQFEGSPPTHCGEMYLVHFCIRRSLSTATHFSLQKVNFESASKVVPNDCNDMFWCISITNNVKSCKKFSEKAQTGKITVFTMVNQHCGAENMEK